MTVQPSTAVRLVVLGLVWVAAGRAAADESDVWDGLDLASAAAKVVAWPGPSVGDASRAVVAVQVGPWWFGGERLGVGRAYELRLRFPEGGGMGLPLEAFASVVDVDLRCARRGGAPGGGADDSGGDGLPGTAGVRPPGTGRRGCESADGAVWALGLGGAPHLFSAVVSGLHIACIGRLGAVVERYEFRGEDATGAGLYVGVDVEARLGSRMLIGIGTAGRLTSAGVQGSSGMVSGGVHAAVGFSF